MNAEQIPVRPTPRGRPRSRVSVGVARKLRRRLTDEEAGVWSRLRLLRATGWHFRRQSPIGDFVVDFVCLKSRIIVELDGSQHGFDGNREEDVERDRALSSLGFRVLRFWNSAVREDIDSVIDTIIARLEGRE